MQANTHVRDISTLRITDAEEAQPKLIGRRRVSLAARPRSGRDVRCRHRAQPAGIAKTRVLRPRI
jgi:hypothetical protein